MAIMRRYVFPIGLPLYVPKNGVFGGLEGEALPRVNTRLLVYRVSKSV